MLAGDGLLPCCTPSQGDLIKAHFIKKEKYPEIQIDMNSWTRVNGLTAWSGPRRNKIGRSMVRKSGEEA